MKDISVIVPVYNVDKYLSECLDSLINQSFTNIEIICVDDGSTDDSLRILEKYSKNDERIRIISQEHGGPGAGRNVGLKNACGKYVFFMDSDDFLELNTLELLYDNITSNESDVAFYGAYKYTDGDTTPYPMMNLEKHFPDVDYSNFTFNYKDAKSFVMNNGYNPVLKLYKKEFLDSYSDFYFPEGIMFEDVPFHVKTMIRASKMSFIPNRLYYYRYNEKSIMNTPENAFDIIKNIDLVEEFIRDNGLYEEFKMELEYFKMKRIVFHIMKSDSEEFFQIAKERCMHITANELFKPEEVEKFNTVLISKNFPEYLIRIYNLREKDFKKLRQDNRRLKNRNKKLKREISNLKSENSDLAKKNDELNKLNDEILTSKSWKITKPLRSFKKSIK